MPKARTRSIIVKKISMRENPVLVTVRPYDRTSVHPSMYASVTSITGSYHGLKFRAQQGGNTPADTLASLQDRAAKRLRMCKMS